MKAETVATQVIDKLLGQTDFTPPVLLWVALYTTAPTPVGGGIEVSINAYARVQVANDAVNWPAAVSGTKANAQTIQFPTPVGPWGTIVAFGLHTDAILDALYMWGTLDPAEAIGLGTDPRFTPGDLAVEET
jgi:hypothetical protein